jgi:uncharacterized glyoxalase superfamily protein PhnB
MKPSPIGWPRVTPTVFYQDANAAIDWLCLAFGFEVRLKVEGEGGSVEHSELTFEDGLIMVVSVALKEEGRLECVSPRSLGGQVTQGIAICVDDADAHCKHARAAGAEIIREPTTSDYGVEYWADRTYGAKDPEGHHWWFMQRVRNPGEPVLAGTSA